MNVLGEFFKNIHTAICRPTINDNVFEIWIFLAQDRAYGIFKKSCLIQGWCDNGYFWIFRLAFHALHLIQQTLQSGFIAYPSPSYCSVYKKAFWNFNTIAHIREKNACNQPVMAAAHFSKRSNNEVWITTRISSFSFFYPTLKRILFLQEIQINYRKAKIDGKKRNKTESHPIRELC